MKPGVAVSLLFLVCVASWGEPEIDGALRNFRHSQRLSLPVLNPRISVACASRAQVLADAGAMAHSDERGRGPGLQMLVQGFPEGEYGEILGSGAQWDEVWEAWLESRPHREVLASKGWTQWGWGRVDSGPTTVWVVRFYRP